MQHSTSRVPSPEKTALSPKHYDGVAEINGDVCLHRRYYTYETEAGLVAGTTFNVMFTIDRPAKDVWPHFKDYNLWQNSYGHYYSGVLGDLEGKGYRVDDTPNEPGPFDREVLRVIPEQLIVTFQPVPADGSNGGISPGFHTYMLNEHGGKTVVTILMQHATRSHGKTEDEALAPYRDYAPESHRKWRDSFIPTLKRLVYEGK